PYFITGVQALSTLAIRKYELEAIPVGYLIIGDGGSVGFIGRARGIPPNKPNLAGIYALAANYMGMRFLYLEAGSGVTSQISSTLISKVRELFPGILIVGGGIKDSKRSLDIARAGADIIVIGTLLESNDFERELKKIVRVTKNIRGKQ
ncbi:MAG: geranylgeranylglyceryl phosphate synthase family protein, partial [Nitrososphaeraceae archaeon]|nr:geranylgeranylglyceryl phosphate synthase family protein [Nitrososphaeraceae archaeon]